jgi:hypothetical protein
MMVAPIRARTVRVISGLAYDKAAMSLTVLPRASRSIRNPRYMAIAVLAMVPKELA